MNENIKDWIMKNVKCCACGGRLDGSKIVNIIVTNKVATWMHPIFGCFDCPGYPPKAMAFICDKCVNNNKMKIRRVIEFEGTPYQVTYHDIDSLEDVDEVLSKIKYYFGKKFRNFTLRAARQECEN